MTLTCVVSVVYNVRTRKEVERTGSVADEHLEMEDHPNLSPQSAVLLLYRLLSITEVHIR